MTDAERLKLADKIRYKLHEDYGYIMMEPASPLYPTFAQVANALAEILKKEGV